MAAAGVEVRWWGHATVGVRDNGVSVLTDPVLTQRLGHLTRRGGGLPDIRRDPPPDVVVLSHLHADHMHLPSLAMVGADTPLLVPRGAADQVRGLRRFRSRLVDVVVGDTVDVRGLRITAVPAVHDGRRWRRGPRTVEALGYLVQGRCTTYFAGDTALFEEVGDWVPDCDVALLPVGGWGPTLGEGHMGPVEAAQAAALVGARLSIPIHYGTLWPIGLTRIRPDRFYTPGTHFAEAAATRGLRAQVLDPGETVSVPPQ